ncbi:MULTISPECIES: phage tail protein [unclassified Moritella]|uniref:phage tail protein n=1 Tax=unclassified Moritella TaxID=2637987 RepID=UPI001BA4A998|nr:MULTISPECIES: phage tail protein [unclassified Moritella]QUM84173.1 phage tail protein [Moritella sp. 28]QUM88474.1 phage tail protein [Moritella sp. 36]
MALLASNYSVEFVEAIDGEEAPIVFKKVYGLNLRLKTARSINQTGKMENIAGDIEPVTLTLERGVGKGLKGLYSWFKNVRNGDVDKKEILITLYNNAQKTDEPAVVWRVKRAFPVALHAPEWDAEENSIAVEKIELIAEDLEVEFPE